jgi:hypothetical protein
MTINFLGLVVGITHYKHGCVKSNTIDSYGDGQCTEVADSGSGMHATI